MPQPVTTNPSSELSVILIRLAAELNLLKVGAAAMEDSIGDLVVTSQEDAVRKHSSDIQYFDRMSQTLDVLAHFTRGLADQISDDVSVNVEVAVQNLHLRDVSERLLTGSNPRATNREQYGDLLLF